jgi:hypothetical protein
MKKHILIAVSCLCTCLPLCAQRADSNLKLIQTIKGNYTNFTVDMLGNIYLLNKEGRLKKIKPNGDSIAVFNDVRNFGKLTAIDASNPLKVLLLYKDFGTVVWLDRLLQVRNKINLRQLQLFQVNTICQAFDNGIWLYDEAAARLKRIKDDGSIAQQTGDLRQQVEEAPAPSFIVDQEKLVYLYDTTKGVFIFDYYGTLQQKLSFVGWRDFQVIDHFLIGRKGTTLLRYQLKTLSLKEMPLPLVLRNVSKTHIAQNKLYCLQEGSLWVYAL